MQTGRPWTDEENALARAMYERGATRKETALAVNRTEAAVYARLANHILAGQPVAFTPAAGVPRTAPPYSQAEDETIMRVLREGGTLVAAGALVGRSEKSVRQRLSALRAAIKPASLPLARDRAIPPRSMRATEEQGIRQQARSQRACRLHLIDLMRSFGASTLGEAKSHYVNRCEYKPQAGTPAYVPAPLLVRSYVGSTAAMCSGD